MSGAGSDVLVGRQCIVDLTGAVVGYELLYRDAVPGGAWPAGEQMTASVVLGALSLGLDRLVGDADIYCNAERTVLVGESTVTLPPERTVIEVLEDVDPDDEVVEGCRRLTEAGFRLALDDFVWREGVERMLDLATYVKIDFRAVEPAQLPALVERCRAHDVVLLAEKVETDAELVLGRELGFELFQGYAVERPVVVRGRTVDPSELARTRLAAALLTDDVDLEEIEVVLQGDPGMAVQLLQYAAVGSDHGTRRPVRSLREAMVLLGSVALRRWVALGILSGQVRSGGRDAVAVALQRARTVQLVATERGVALPDVAFTAGLLSALDLLLGVEVVELDGSLQLDAQLEDAAFRQEGQLGRVVADVVRHERARRGFAPQGSAPREPAADVVDELDAAAAQAFTWTVHTLG